MNNIILNRSHAVALGGHFSPRGQCPLELPWWPEGLIEDLTEAPWRPTGKTKRKRGRPTQEPQDHRFHM